MMMMRALTLLAAAGLWAAPAQASSCSPQFVERSVTLNANPDAFGAGETYVDNLSVRTRNDGSGNQCSAIMRIARLSTSPWLGQVDYGFSKGNTAIPILPSETIPGNASGGLFIPQLPGNRNGSNVPFKIVFPTEWGLPAGIAVDELELQLVDASGSITDRIPLRIVFIVPAAIELRIVGATGFNPIAGIDMGTLEPDQINTSSPFGLRVWSTAPYSIAFRSENGGKLVHDERLGAIDYDLQLNMQAVGLNGGIARTVGQHTDALGDLHPLRVMVRPFRTHAGNYGDRVVVTVSTT